MQLGPVDYVTATQDWRKVKSVCHVNLLTKYFERDQHEFPSVEVSACNFVDVPDSVESESVSARELHLDSFQSFEVNELISEFGDIFSEPLGKTYLVEHRIKLTPSPFRCCSKQISSLSAQSRQNGV